MKKRFLISGFEPFHTFQKNPSQLIVGELQQSPVLQAVCDFVILPVTFAKAFKKLSEFSLSSYEGIIMMGLAARRDQISLERVALNWTESETTDNAGEKRLQGPIIPGGEAAYFSKAPIENWIRLLDQKFPEMQKISLSAGAFVCNYLYYLVEQQIHRKRSWSVFIHLPEFEDGKPGRLSLEKQQEWARYFFEECLLKN